VLCSRRVPTSSEKSTTGDGRPNARGHVVIGPEQELDLTLTTVPSTPRDGRRLRGIFCFCFCPNEEGRRRRCLDDGVLFFFAPARRDDDEDAWAMGSFIFFCPRGTFQRHFFYPNRAAMSAQQHPAVKSPQCVLQCGLPAVGAPPRGPLPLKFGGDDTVELVLCGAGSEEVFGRSSFSSRKDQLLLLQRPSYYIDSLPTRG
jgi:hypothetical protein